MSVSDTFIKRPVLTTVCSILTVVAGLICLPLLPIENLPQVALPTIDVSTTFAGGSAETVEQAVTIPPEEAINGVPEANYITSQSTGSGQSSITVTLDEGAGININQVNQANPQLPDSVRSTGVLVTQSNPSFLAVCQVVAEGNRYSRDFLNELVLLNLIYTAGTSEGNSGIYLPAGWRGTPSFNLYRSTSTWNRRSSPHPPSRHLMWSRLLRAEPCCGRRLSGRTTLPSAAGVHVPDRNSRLLLQCQRINEMILRRTPDGNTIHVRDVGSTQLGINSYFLKGY